MDDGQVERMNCTIKDATVKRYFYESHDQLRTHLRDFVSAYNFARRLKTLKGLTPYEFVCKAWTSQPQRFKLNPLQQMPGRKHLAPISANLSNVCPTRREAFQWIRVDARRRSGSQAPSFDRCADCRVAARTKAPVRAFESREGFPAGSRRASLRHAIRYFPFRHVGRP